MAGTFSYAGTAAAAITTARDQTRLEVGDTDPDAVLFYNEEIDVYLATRANAVLVPAADLCDAAATRFARGYDFGVDAQTFDRSQMTKAFQDRAKQLRARASGITSLPATRVDGYSQDVDADDVSGGTASSAVRQRFYTVGGVDRLPLGSSGTPTRRSARPATEIRRRCSCRALPRSAMTWLSARSSVSTVPC